MNRSEYSANLDMQPAKRAAWMEPAPRRARRPAGLLACLLACLLGACGGGSADVPADIECNPDSWDCARIYAEFPYRFTPDTAEGADVYSFNPAPRHGFTRAH